MWKTSYKQDERIAAELLEYAGRVATLPGTRPGRLKAAVRKFGDYGGLKRTEHRVPLWLTTSSAPPI